MKTPVDSLEYAITLFKQGKRSEAQKLLKQLIGADPHNPYAWFWLAKTYPTNEQRLNIMEACLKYNPGNERVKQLLDELRIVLAEESKTTQAADGKRLRLRPGDKVRVKEDVGEFYADFPDYTILIVTKDSEGTTVSFEEFQSDFEKRRERNGHEDRQMYEQHFFVVREAMDQCLQYPIRFERVNPPSERVDLVRSQAGRIELVDTAALEMLGTSHPEYINAINPDSESIIKRAYAYQPSQAFHDEHKLKDLILALALAHAGPPAPEDSEIIYLRHTSLLAAYGLWCRLKLPVDEEALNIILSLHDTTSRHQGCGWTEIERMIEINSAKKPLWYTIEQKETLTKWIDRLRQEEKEESYQKLSREGNPEIRRQIEATPWVKALKENAPDKSASTSGQLMACPSCGHSNPAWHAACEKCGQRLYLSSAGGKAATPHQTLPARPGCLTIYAVLVGISAAFWVLVGVRFILGLLMDRGNFISTLAGTIAIFILAGLLFLLSQGLVNQKNWARIAAILMEILSIPSLLLAILIRFMQFSPEAGNDPTLFICLSIIRMGFSVYIIYWFAANGTYFRRSSKNGG